MHQCRSVELTGLVDVVYCFFFAGKEMIVVQMTEIVHIVQSIYWVQMNALVYSLQCQLSVFRSPWE